MKCLVTNNEAVRLRALHQCRILDTPPEDRFDRIVRRAARQFDVPIALFTLVDERRQWFKSRVGLSIQETDRAISFCSHAVAVDAPLVVEDTSTNELFASNPLVTGHPRIAFYAGVPVHASGGEALGTLCIIDNSPRLFPWQDFLVLKALAAKVEIELESRRTEMDRIRQA